jgi:hypothetical protein
MVAKKCDLSEKCVWTGKQHKCLIRNDDGMCVCVPDKRSTGTEQVVVCTGVQHTAPQPRTAIPPDHTRWAPHTCRNNVTWVAKACDRVCRGAPEDLRGVRGVFGVFVE